MTATDYAADIPLQAARAAFAAVSFDPEGRARRTVEDYAAALAADYQYLAGQAAAGGAQLDPGDFSRFRDGCRKRFLAYLHSSSRCISWFIAGPSKFPAERMNKRADIAHKRLQEYLDYRDHAKRTITKRLRPDLRPIYAGDSDALDRLEAELQKAERKQALMVATNATIRKQSKHGRPHVMAALMELGHTEKSAELLTEPGNWYGMGYAPFELTNNGATIRRLKQRIEQVSRAKAAPTVCHEGTAATIEDDPPANRIRLIFPGKPDADIRSRLKSCGFRWSPSIGAWQAYRSPHTLSLAKELAA